MLSIEFSCDQLASTVSSVPAETLNVRSHFQSEICYAMPALQALVAFLGGLFGLKSVLSRLYCELPEPIVPSG